MLGTEEYNYESTIVNSASMICDKNKVFLFKSFLKMLPVCVILKIDTWA